MIVCNSKVSQTTLLGSAQIIYTTDKLDSEECCGNISSRYFSYSVETFSEAQKFNTCLNKKISIDKHGNIKNCPSMQKSFRAIRKTSLADALANIDFKKLFNIHKDQIDVCKDCQFRYICIDCRAYLDNLFAKPAKCKYDPYQHIGHE